jgi:hypothetical protein
MLQPKYPPQNDSMVKLSKIHQAGFFSCKFRRISPHKFSVLNGSGVKHPRINQQISDLSFFSNSGLLHLKKYQPETPLTLNTLP